MIGWLCDKISSADEMSCVGCTEVVGRWICCSGKLWNLLHLKCSGKGWVGICLEGYRNNASRICAEIELDDPCSPFQS